jgi:carbon-monoxide dehydrogenase large subunit
MEGILYDPETGQMQTGSFLDYAMPRASDFCPFELADNPTVTKVNPMGSKGAGEVGTACAMPTVVNAVVDALSPLGIKHLDMPVTSQKTWAVIKNAIIELKG